MVFRGAMPGVGVAVMAASALFASNVLAETDGWGREWYADVSVASYLYSLGSVRANHAVWMMEATSCSDYRLQVMSSSATGR